MPPSWTAFAPRYRRSTAYVNAMGLGRGYPRYYFRSDPLLGFDIIPLATGKHVTKDDLEYDIFANDLGCFDKNSREDFSVSPQGYAYFTGDSFTWGYARYENKFATVWEHNTGILTAKCGVTHTGPRYQFEKFKRVTQAIGRQPKIVFVGFFANDIANDFAFPHSTVIHGWMVNTVYSIGKRAIRRIPYEEVESAVLPKMKEFEDKISRDLIESASLWHQFKGLLIRHSLLTNLVRAAWKQIVPEKSLDAIQRKKTQSSNFKVWRRLL